MLQLRNRVKAGSERPKIRSNSLSCAARAPETRKGGGRLVGLLEENIGLYTSVNRPLHVVKTLTLAKKQKTQQQNRSKKKNIINKYK